MCIPENSKIKQARLFKAIMLLSIVLTLNRSLFAMDNDNCDEEVRGNQAFAIVTYNLAMGVHGDTREKHLTTKAKALNSFASNFVNIYFNSNLDMTWFICAQEINRNDLNGVNQVDQLQEMLIKGTGCKWYKHSNTQSQGAKKEAVAIFSNKELTEVERWTFDQHRVAVAVRSEDKIWVVTAHPIKPEADINGKLREAMLKEINQKMTTFGQMPQVLCGDFNIYDTAEGSFSISVEQNPVFSKKIFNKTVGYLLKNDFQRGGNFTPSACDATFHSWNKTNDRENGFWGILDYIFVRNMEGKEITNPEVLNFKDDMKYISDHKGLIMKINGL